MINSPLPSTPAHTASILRLKQWVDVPGAYLAISFGLMLIVVPGLLLRLLGFQPDTDQLLVARLYGAVLINIGGVSGWASKSTDLKFNRLFAGLNTFVDLLSAVVLVDAGCDGRLTVIGWGLAGVFAYQGVVNVLVSYRIARGPAANAAP